MIIIFNCLRLLFSVLFADSLIAGFFLLKLPSRPEAVWGSLKKYFNERAGLF